MKKRFTEEQIIGILREAEAGEKTIGELARAHGISEPTFYVWRRKYGAIGEPDVKRLRELASAVSSAERRRERAAQAPAGRALRRARRDEGVPGKKVADVPSRRAFVKFAVARELSTRRACEMGGVSRRRLGYTSRRRDKDDALLARLKELTRQRPRFGYQRLHQMLRRDGHQVNVKRVRRLCVLHGLKLSRKVRRKAARA